MKANILKKWVNALRAGKYHQTQEALKNVQDGQAGFCCLGVLTQLYCKETGTKWDNARRKDGDEMLSRKVMDWAGLGKPNPYLRIPKHLREKAGNLKGATAIDLNDGNAMSDAFSFREIADCIEETYK